MSHVRPMVDAERDAVEALVAAAFAPLRQVYRYQGGRPALPPGQTLVAVDGERVVGALTWWREGDVARFYRLAVDAGARRQGVARALIEELSWLALRAGATRLRACTVEETGNRAVFEALGFDVVGRETPADLTGAHGPVHELTLERVLLWPGEFTFCPKCAARLVVVDRNGRARTRCPECRFIHWRNPALGAAAVVFDDRRRLLMVQRAPGMTQAGRWSIPAGYVDYGEDVRDAAARELREETGIIATMGEVVWTASNFHDREKLTVGLWFAATRTGGTLCAGDDASDAGWFPLDALPPLAFPTDAEYLSTL